MPHIHELYDFAVAVFIVYGEKVLLVEHPKYDKWLPVGGHIDLDEDPEQALFKEVDEETGLKVKILSSKPEMDEPGTKFLLTPNYMEVHDANPPHKHITLVYFALAENNQHTMSEEHTDMRWISVNELDKPEYGLRPSIKFYCKEAINAAKSSI